MLVGANILGFSRGGCILDVLGYGVSEVAFGLRRLTASYTGKCINVRRSSDNSAIDIGFVGNRLDIVTLLFFVGSGSGYVTKWYNHGTLGSAGDLTQPTAAFQPTIVSAGSLVTLNGQPTMQFKPVSGGAIFLNAPAAISPSGSISSTINAVMNVTQAVGETIAPLNLGTATTHEARSVFLAIPTSGPITWNSSIGGVGCNSSLSATLNTPFLLTAIFTTSTSGVWLNGSAGGTTTGFSAMNTVPSASRLGEGWATDYWPGTIAEVVMPFTALTTVDRQLLEHSQESYFGISGS